MSLRKPARMSDVAREAGVALATVSRVLNAPELVAPATREKVLGAVARLGYVPDLNAGSLASARSRIVGAVVPTLLNAWFADTMEGLAAALAPAGYQLMLAQSNYHAQAEAGLVQAFLGRRVEGLVLTGGQHDDAVRATLRRLRLPVVETWDLPEKPIDLAVGFSNVAAGEAVGRHLRERGRRRVGFIGADEPRSLQRRDGLQRALGVPAVPCELVEPPSTLEAGEGALQRLLEREPRLDALFCSNDILALGALLQCRRQGWAVPDRLAVVGFSDLAMARAAWPALTTVRVDAQALGRAAGRLLLQRLAGQKPARRVQDLGFTLVERDSG